MEIAQTEELDHKTILERAQNKLKNTVYGAGKGLLWSLKKYGEVTDWADQAVGIPNTDIDLYAARHKLIDPLAEKHFLLGLAGEVVLPDSIDIATWGLTYIPNRILKLGKAGIKTWAKTMSKLNKTADPIADMMKSGKSLDEIEAFVRKTYGEKAQIAFMAGNRSDEYADLITGASASKRVQPTYTYNDVPTKAPARIRGEGRTYYSNRYGDENVDKIADFMEDAYVLYGNTSSLKGAGRISIGDYTYKVRKNVRQGGVVDVIEGKGLKLAPMLNNRQLDALNRSQWEWNRDTVRYVREWFAEKGAAPHIAENYIKLQREDKRILKKLIAEANRQYKALHPNWKQADLLSVGHGKSLSKGGPDVSRNVFPENLGKNAQRSDTDDLPDIILSALGNPITIEEDMLRFLVGPRWYKDFFNELGGSLKSKWANMIGRGMDPDDALQIMWEEGGNEVRKNPFFANWHENVKMPRHWERNRRWLSGEWGPFWDTGKHGGWLHKRP